ncbi:Uncharacterised protein [Mycobacterium tuberculosis]|nr:Uncharacterised protein [Mycobacterium tuberculosis]
MPSFARAIDSTSKSKPVRSRPLTMRGSTGMPLSTTLLSVTFW